MDRRRIDRAADVAARRRKGSSRATIERVRQSFLEADDLRSQCRFCGQVRRGTLAEVTGTCPGCGAEGKRHGTD